MNKDDVLGFAKKAIPWIGAAATGNVPVLVAMASQAVSDALGVKVEATPTAIANAVAGATPEQMIALKEAENTFSLRMKELNYKEVTELYAAEVTDRNGAREREAKVGDNTNRLLAFLIVLAWMIVQGFLLTHVVDSTMRELVARVLGTLDAALTMVLSYYYGSSRGSDAKTQILAYPKRE